MPEQPLTVDEILDQVKDPEDIQRGLVALSGQLCWIRREPPPDGYKESHDAIMAEIETKIVEVRKQIENLEAERSQLGGNE